MSMVMYAGTLSGFMSFKSEDGVSWEPLGKGLNLWEVTQHQVHPAAPNRVLAGTRGDGVWVSEDFGQTWGKPSYGKRGPGKVRCVTLDRRNPDVVYAGTEPIDLFVSPDSAKDWELVSSLRDLPFVSKIGYPVPTVEPHVREVVQDPKTPDTLYAALQVGYMVRSTDNGKTWTRLDNGLDEDVHVIAIDPSNTKRILVATGGEGRRQGHTNGKCIYKTEDGGETWEGVAMEFDQDYSIAIAFHPKDPSIMYTGLTNGIPPRWERPTGAESVVLRSEDGGNTWKQLNGSLKETTPLCPAAFLWDDKDPDRMYIGFRSGELYMSVDGGDSFKKLDTKLPAIDSLQVLHV